MQEALHIIADFAFECGAQLDLMTVGYATHGSLNARKDNAILVTHGTSANRHTYDVYIGPGKAFDTNKYFVIAVDAIGGGTSSSPNDGLAIDFPRYSIRDMVNAQHHLLTNGLGLTSLVAVGGPSMGAFQALEWGIAHADFAKGLLLIVPAARTPGNFKAVVDTMIEVIKLDPAWSDGRYTHNPVAGLRRAAMVFGPWFLSDAYFEAQATPAQHQQALMVMVEAFVKWDAVSFMWRYLASRAYDASQAFAGDMAIALGKVKAKALVMPSVTDRVLPTFGAREILAGVHDCVHVEIPSILGHMAQNPLAGLTREHQFVDAAIAGFLELLN